MAMTKKKILIISLLTILIAGVGYALYLGSQAYTAWDRMYEERESEEDYVQEEKLTEPFTILLLGVDNEDGDVTGRSDVLMLAVVDPVKKDISLLSIPRDTLAPIAGRETEEKINHAYSYGLDTAIETVENFLDIKVDHYVALNFDAFRDLIDVMGGIELDVERKIFHNVRTDHVYLYPGVQTISGQEALRYVRFRSDSEGDFGRIRRQQQVIGALLDQSMDMRNVTKLHDILNVFGDNVRHDIPFSKMMSLTQQFATVDSDNLKRLTLEGSSEKIGPYWYVIIEEEEQRRVQNELKTLLRGSMFSERKEHPNRNTEDEQEREREREQDNNS